MISKKLSKKKKLIEIIHLLYLINGILIFISSKKYISTPLNLNIEISASIINYLLIFIVNIFWNKIYLLKDHFFITISMFFFQCFINIFILSAKYLPIDSNSLISQTSFDNTFDLKSLIIIPFLTLIINLIVPITSFFTKKNIRKDIISIDRKEKTLHILVGFFIGLIFITNVITIKYIKIFNLTVTCGIISYPFTFLITDIVSELYGEEISKKVIYKGFFANVIILLMTFIISKIKFSDYGLQYKKDLDLLYTMTPGIIFGSFIAYIVSQLCDVKLYSYIKKLSNNKYLWIRNNVSTIISEIVDTLVFAIVVWVIWPKINSDSIIKPIDWKIWLDISLTEYVFKCVIAFFDTFILYGALSLIKRIIDKKIRAS